MLRRFLLSSTEAISARSNDFHRFSSASTGRGIATTNQQQQQPEEADKPASSAELELQAFLAKCQSDAHFRMLASPLRRCSATQVILPRELMFRMTSHRVVAAGAQEEEGETSTSNFDLEEEEIKSRMARKQEGSTDERNALLRRRSRRWVLKEEKKSVVKTLLRVQRMTLHKVTTSQTPESRDRFSKQLSDIKDKLAQYKKPLPRGLLLPFGLTKESERTMKGIARGRGVWCTLNKKIVTALFKTNVHKTLETTLPLTKDVPSLVQVGLEKRVVEEAQILFQKLICLPREERSNNNGWLIRRMRGSEVRIAMEQGLIKLRDDEQESSSSLAGVLVSKGGNDIRLLNQEDRLPLYQMDRMILDEQRSVQFKDLLRKIADALREKGKKEVKGSWSTGPIATMDKTLKPKAAADDTTISHEKWPRLHAIKRDERTVPLCIALWRLHTWTAPD